MDKVEKVVSGLEYCIQGSIGCHMGCPYADEPACRQQLCRDAISVLDAQKPRVLTWDEVRLLGKDVIVWYEYKGAFQPRPRVVKFVFDEHITFTDGGNWSFSADGYGERWRLWTSRPTDGQREATPWE